MSINLQHASLQEMDDVNPLLGFDAGTDLVPDDRTGETSHQAAGSKECARMLRLSKAYGDK